MAKLNVIISAKIGGLVKGLGEAKKRLKSFGSFAGNVTKGLAVFGAGIIGAIVKIGAMGGKLIQTQIAMEAFLGSAEKAKQLILDLRKFADATPFDTNSMLEAGKIISSVQKDVKKILPVMKMLGNISAGSGKDLTELAKLYAKMMRNQKIDQEDLNQLYDSGALSQKSLAIAIGISESRMREYTRAGKVGFGDVEKALKSATSEGGKFFGLLDKMSRQFLGKLSTLKGKLQNLAIDIGGPLQNSLISITDTFIDWVDQAKTLRGPLGLLIKDLRLVADLLELTRSDGSLEKVTGLKGLNKFDVGADTLAGLSKNVGGVEINPLAVIGRLAQMAGLGQQAKGEELLQGIKEEMERMNTNIKGGIN